MEGHPMVCLEGEAPDPQMAGMWGEGEKVSLASCCPLLHREGSRECRGCGVKSVECLS